MKTFLIWIDILGFEDLAKEIKSSKGIDTRKIRNDFLNVINEKIKKTKTKKLIIGMSVGRDDWILVTEDLQKAFLTISEILDHDTGYEGYRKIPLEIAIGSEEFDKRVKFNKRGLICEDKTIEWLKTNIVGKYRNEYKNKHNKPIKETFVLISGSVYAGLKESQKRRCEEYSYKKTNEKGEAKEHHFYYLPLNVIERERKISDFLEKIHQPRSEYSGALIDKIFVPPDEFDEIKRVLENDRIVFITGTPGYGKTYTAIRLLWEWYNKGYIPDWVRGKEEKERIEVREKLANIDALLKPHHIIYFEDPFGKTRYERRDDLKERINFIISSVKNKEDVYVIITSRKDIFEEFEKEVYSVEEINKFEKKLNIMKPSYSYGKRKEILEKWAQEKGCKWLGDENMKTIVFELLRYEINLPTPLSIHDFVEATVKTKDELELRQKIYAYSKAFEKAFADEIKGLYDSGRRDRVLFLSFIFVSEHSHFAVGSIKLEVGFVRQEYKRLKERDFEDFEMILKEEYRVKIEKWGGDKVLEFSHPLYFNALPHILEHAGCRDIFCKVLTDLSEKDEAAGVVALAVKKNFDKLSEDVRNELLFKLSEKDKAAGDVAEVVAGNFDELPENVRNKLLFKLSEKDKGAATVAWLVGRNFNDLFYKLTEDVRNELLLKLSEKDEAAWEIARVIAANFYKLPGGVRNLLFKLSEKDETARDVADAVAKNFDKLPEGVRNELLLKLAEKNGTARAVADAVARNFNKLPENVRNLLFILAEKDEAAGGVAYAVADYFNKLPENVRNLLLILAEKDDAAGDVAQAVINNFTELPEEVRNELLLKLCEKGVVLQNF